MTDNKKKIILVIVCLICIALICGYLWLPDKSGSNTVREYVNIDECINSINSLYGETIIDRKSFSDVKSYANSKMALKMIDKLLFDKDTKTAISLKLGNSKKISRTEWLDILKMITSANGMEDICTNKKINAYSVLKDSKQIISDCGIYNYNGVEENLVDKNLEAYVREDNIIFVVKISDEVIFENVLIKNSKDESITTVLEGAERNIRVKGLKETLNGVICDIYMKNGNLSKLKLKRDSISGKVQAISSEGIEIEGFGNVLLNEKNRIYSTYDDYSAKSIDVIQVGEENLRFIVADKKICAVLIDKTPTANNIRVLIKTSGYKEMLHDSVIVSSNGEFLISYYVPDINGELKEQQDLYNVGDTFTFKSDNEKLKIGRIKIIPKDENGKIILNSVSRNGKNPEYRGTIEIALCEGKLAIVNELSLEQYLYAVVPSEMPTSYGVEALKVQAVCARSYAVSHMNNGKLSEYGAQVDDSTDYQVYNVTPENENSISAVKATFGQVLKCGDEIANTYFFSTSCGSTTDSTVWGGNALPYIKGKLLSKDENMDLSDNKIFTEFIKKDYKTFDSGNPWYRWNFKMTNKELSSSINGKIAKIYLTNPENVLTWTDEGFVSKTVTNLGNISDIYVEKRGVGGTIEELIIKGDKAVIKIIKQSAIRNLIDLSGITLNKNDGSSVNNFTALPSAFFTVEKDGDYFVFYGGGYGHGAGMSQCAVKNMIEAGMNYEEILKFFYDNVEIKFVYE